MDMSLQQRESLQETGAQEVEEGWELPTLMCQPSASHPIQSISLHEMEQVRVDIKEEDNMEKVEEEVHLPFLEEEDSVRVKQDGEQEDRMEIQHQDFMEEEEVEGIQVEQEGLVLQEEMESSS